MVDNEQILRRLVEESVNRDLPELLPEFVHPDVRVHPGTPGSAPDTVGIDELQASFRRLHHVLEDLHIALEDVLVTEDRVAARWTATGTHRAEFVGIPATGRSVRWGGIDIYRLTDGKVAEWWRNDDVVGLLQQLGRDPLTA